MEDEMDASDIRDLINDIQSFYQQCFIAGVNISSNNVDLEELKNRLQNRTGHENTSKGLF